MKAYKGFNTDMTCLGFQYREGETYETDKAKLCNSGFHACERPLDVFKYYEPAKSVYHEVELEDVSDERKYDSKVCGKKITIGAKLSIDDLVKAQIEYTKQHCTTEHTDPKFATSGYKGVSTSGDSGVATSGDGGVATSGDMGVAKSGDSGVATSGDMGVATSGYKGVSTSGYMGVATSGDKGVSTSRGKSAVGKNGIAVARGNDVRVKGGLGAVLVIAEENQGDCDIKDWCAFVVDGEVYKPDTWYALVDGELKEVEA